MMRCFQTIGHPKGTDLGLVDMDNFSVIVNSLANGVSSSDSVFSTVLIENFRTP